MNDLSVLQGSSRVTGGHLGGKALGSSVNIANINSSALSAGISAMKGRIKLYIVNYNPSVMKHTEVNPTGVVSLDMVPTIQPILEKLIQRFDTLSDNKHTIYVLSESGEWELKGKYNIACEDDEEVFWNEDTGIPVVHILVVSNFLLFNKTYRLILLIIELIFWLFSKWSFPFRLCLRISFCFTYTIIFIWPRLYRILCCLWDSFCLFRLSCSIIFRFPDVFTNAIILAQSGWSCRILQSTRGT